MTFWNMTVGWKKVSADDYTTLQYRPLDDKILLGERVQTGPIFTHAFV